jgi:hypothetical protein
MAAPLRVDVVHGRGLSGGIVLLRAPVKSNVPPMSRAKRLTQR